MGRRVVEPRDERHAQQLERSRRWHAKNKAYDAEQSMAWQKANPEKTLEISRRSKKARRAADPEKFRKQARDQLARDRERINSRRRERYVERREIVLAQIKAWVKANPEKVAAAKVERNARRRALVKGAAVVERIDRAAIIARDKSTCHLCGKRVARKDMTLDHIVPLAAGGDHCAANVAAAHFLCNSRKGARAANDQLRLVG